MEAAILAHLRRQRVLVSSPRKGTLQRLLSMLGTGHRVHVRWEKTLLNSTDHVDVLLLHYYRASGGADASDASAAAAHRDALLPARLLCRTDHGNVGKRTVAQALLDRSDSSSPPHVGKQILTTTRFLSAWIAWRIRATGSRPPHLCLRIGRRWTLTRRPCGLRLVWSACWRRWAAARARAACPAPAARNGASPRLRARAPRGPGRLLR